MVPTNGAKNGAKKRCRKLGSHEHVSEL
jgi:hypothetical protein